MEMQQLPLCGSRLVLYRRALWMPLARSFAEEGKRRAGCALFRNQRDARVRVLRNSATSYFALGLTVTGLISRNVNDISKRVAAWPSGPLFAPLAERGANASRRVRPWT